jgi:hypothetical protein
MSDLVEPKVNLSPQRWDAASIPLLGTPQARPG